MRPPLRTVCLLAAVMAVAWAIAASALGALIILGFGRGGSPVRHWSTVLIEALVVALLCAGSYRQGWRDAREDLKDSRSLKPKSRLAA